MISVLRIIYKICHVFGSVFIAVRQKHKVEDAIPPVGDRKLLLLSASDIAEMIRNREVTSEKVVLEEARKVDKLIQSGEYDKTELKDKFPLLGVPFTIKDSFCVAGLRHTAGSYYRKDIIAAEDAEVVKSLKSVGAIPIGVTNVPELCMWWESHNTVYGRSRNPYDTRHITGGSSGGEAAVQGAAGSAFGIGSDIAGSIRVPSLFCGIFGHKPTSGIISCWGQQPEVKGRLVELLTTGPMGSSRQRSAPHLRRAHRRKHPEMKDALRKAVQHLEQTYGVKAQVSACNGLRRGKANFSKLYHSLEIWVQAVSGAGGVPFYQPILGVGEILFRISPHTLPAIMLGIIEKMAYIGNQLPRHKQLIEMGYSLAKEIQDVLKDDAVLLYPSFPSPAPRITFPFRPADFSYCAVFNVLGVPVTQVPLGLGSKGLPLGVQSCGWHAQRPHYNQRC
ncbi:Fatty-acid amide hydrolase 2 [Orchesella cincta]|uniref:Fatty-acid amide hydrolase 2 n=1 Tax=Orchesella cincta TaxID=48709 RepID=A0A1D2MFV8_ORCCI|nr:Fatty-acid amide hydrolase 2 [Orchesella cincta]